MEGYHNHLLFVPMILKLENYCQILSYSTSYIDSRPQNLVSPATKFLITSIIKIRLR